MEIADPMAWALIQAQQALLLSTPNPRVGCVLIDERGHLIGQGHTQAAGGAHAEVMALHHAQQNDGSARGVTAYVTLEPCRHQGRTPPCTQALIAAGVTRVIYALKDPNPQVNGQGLAQLQAHGIEVQASTPAHAATSLHLNRAFFSRFIRKRPWVRLKTALSADGRTTQVDGRPYLITSQQAQQDGHFFRAQACVLLTGVGTVLADDPRLDVRCINNSSCHQPALAIVDSQLRTPLNAKAIDLARNGGRPVVIYTIDSSWGQQAAWEKRGVEVVRLEPLFASVVDQAGVNLNQVLQNLFDRGWQEVHVESGARLAKALLQDDLVDEWLAYQSPIELGQGPSLQEAWLKAQHTWQVLSCEKLGLDQRVVLQKDDTSTWAPCR